MKNDNTIEVYREELKAKIQENYFCSLSQTLAVYFANLLNKSFRLNIPIELIQFFFTVFIVALGIVLSVILKIIPQFEIIVLGLVSITYILVLQFTFEHFIKKLLHLVCDSMLDAFESVDDFQLLEIFLSNAFSHKRQILAGLSFTVLAHGIFLIFNISLINVVGWPLLLTHIFFNFFHGILVYYFFCYLMGFLRNLGKFHFVLFEANPSASEMVQKIDSTLNVSLYMIIAFGTVFSVWMTFAAKYSFPKISVVFSLFFLWTACISLFVLNKNTVSKIIRNGKWRSLNKIQSQISLLLAKNVVDTQTLEQVNKLLDYHDRVQATPNSIFSMRSVFDLVNSILIPSLGLILGNMNVLSTALQYLKLFP